MATETHNNPSRQELESGKIFAEIMNLFEDTRKKQAETQKITAETKWHPFYRVAILWGSAFAAAIALIKLSNRFL